ncbi:hypothetical protein BSKO_10032 [Bryopsis sp. KO-2023]|nr:hypothetical protein BSKO_10032 [Bryopsis sp. KO-2023]
MQRTTRIYWLPIGQERIRTRSKLALVLIGLKVPGLVMTKMPLESAQRSDQSAPTTAASSGESQGFEFQGTSGMHSILGRSTGRRYRRAIRIYGKKDSAVKKGGANAKEEEVKPASTSWDELPVEIVNMIVEYVKRGSLRWGDTLKNMRLINTHWKTAVGFSVTEMYRDLEEPEAPEVLKKLGDAFPNITSLQSHRAAAGVEHLYMLPKLKSLSLWGTWISDENVALIFRVTTLTSLNLGCTKTAREGLRAVSKLINLTDLDLGETAIIPDDLECLVPLCNLESLTLGLSRWTWKEYSKAATHLASLPKLKSLDIGYANASAIQLKKVLPRCSIRLGGRIW